MFEIKEKPKMVERAFLVAAYFGGETREEAESLIEELWELTNTLGVPVKGSLLVPLREPQARLLMGSGKAEQVVAAAKQVDADVIIFDNELSPAQQRNWEELSKIAVIDRQEVILDIFAQRAQTREARLQVDLARLEYSLPRLTRAWSHLGQQAGGIGGKGEGEAQLELDRRLIRAQIDRLKREIAQVKVRRATQRKERQRIPLPNAAIVGYTNAGKSSLLRALTGADVLVEDKLFATLDTTTRKVRLPNNQDLLLTDTVGFVRKLPHRLVEAFNATLEESVVADFLVHVLDATQPRVFDFFETTTRVLGELGAESKRMITVFNKIDRMSDPSELSALKLHFPEAVFVSAKTGENLGKLLERMGAIIDETMEEHDLAIPLSRGDVLASLHRNADVLTIDYRDDHARVKARIPQRFAADYAWFATGSPGVAIAPWPKPPSREAVEAPTTAPAIPA